MNRFEGLSKDKIIELAGTLPVNADEYNMRDIEIADHIVKLWLADNPKENPFYYEAACSGLKYTTPEACGEVSAIWINGKRYKVTQYAS